MRNGIEPIVEVKRCPPKALVLAFSMLGAMVGVGALALAAPAVEDPSDTEAAAELFADSESRLDSGRCHKALTSVNAALERLPGSFDGYYPHYLRGQINLCLDDPDQALRDFRRELELGAIQSDTHYHDRLLAAMPKAAARAKVKQAIRRFRAGEISPKDLLEETIEIEKTLPDDAQVQNAVGYSHEELNEIDKALERYERASRLDPEWKLPVYSMADLRREQGHIDEALELYERGLGTPARAEDEARHDVETRQRLLELAPQSSRFVREEDFLAWRQGRADVNTRGFRLVPTGEGTEKRMALGTWLFEKEQSSLSFLMQLQLDGLARLMKSAEWGEAVVRLIGHASPDGPEGYNTELSRRRAETVRGYLTKAGLAPDMFRVTWKGESEPRKKPDGTDDLERSRRVELALVR